ncbi:MAG: cytochrome c [Burkholderiales bacterium]|nr:cytochrome c [Burkholderiales bacterium]
MKKTIGAALTALALGGAALLPTSAMAQFAKPEDAIKYRQAALTLMSNHMGRLAAMVRGNVPYDAAAAESSAKLVDTLGHLPWSAFVPGSDGGASKAKPALFQNLGDLKALSERLNGETTKLVSAAGSLDSLRTQVGATAAACKACHDKYRNM